MKTNELPNIKNAIMPNCGAYGQDYVQSGLTTEEIEAEVWAQVTNQFLLPQAYNSYFVSSIGRVYCSGFTYKTETGKAKIHLAHFRKIYLSKTNRYATNVRHIFNNRPMLNMHVLLAIAFKNHIPDGHSIVVDHIDNDPINNRLSNLQLITNRENTSKDRVNGKSQYIGVYIKPRTKKIYSNISYIDTGIVCIGRYPTQRQAGMAYLAAIEYGEHHPGKNLNRIYIKFIKDIVDQIVASFDDFESQADDYLEYPAKKEFDFNTITPDFSILTKKIVRKTERKKEKHITVDELVRDLFGNK